MPKFIVEVCLDGYDSEEEADLACSEDTVSEALGDYGFSVISVKRESDPEPCPLPSKCGMIKG